jgi:adenylate cyclase
MSVEIERKFLVTSEAWRASVCSSIQIHQGYLSKTQLGGVRVRRYPDSAWITVKSRRTGICRTEFEYEIPKSDADQMLRDLCCRPTLKKVRHDVYVGASHWQIDVFGGAGEGLVLAEIELQSPDQPFDRPPWIGAEVTLHPLFRSSAIAAGRWRRTANDARGPTALSPSTPRWRGTTEHPVRASVGAC